MWVNQILLSNQQTLVAHLFFSVVKSCSTKLFSLVNDNDTGPISPAKLHNALELRENLLL